MKRIFLSLPMSGRSDKEICDQIEEMKAKFLLKNPFGKGEEIIFVHNFDYNPYNYDIFYSSRDFVKTVPLLYLGNAIQRMAYCEGVYFGEGWSKARGCLIEMEVCVKYDIPYFINRNDGVICKVIDDFKEEDTEDEKEYNGEKPFDNRKSGRYPWDKIEKEGFCSVCAIEKGSPTCEKCKHKEEKNNE